MIRFHSLRRMTLLTAVAAATVCSQDVKAQAPSNSASGISMVTVAGHAMRVRAANVSDRKPGQPVVVLVGHSYGGVLIRAFASDFPTEVVGLVYVDAPSIDMTFAELDAVSPDARRYVFDLGSLPPNFLRVSGLNGTTSSSSSERNSPKCVPYVHLPEYLRVC
jgi:pimeloyl-ACP methyl ester carboxylesterase